MTPPERIENWQGTQLSIAKYFGGIIYQGREYVISYNEPGQPLVMKKKGGPTKKQKEQLQTSFAAFAQPKERP